MKNHLIISIFFIVSASYCSLSAQLIRAQHAYDSSSHTILIGSDFFIDIYMDNNTFADVVGYSMPFVFYSPDSINDVQHINVQGYSAIYPNNGPSYNDSSILMVNGFDSYWQMFNQWTGFSWDGGLPDTINHSVADLSGWPWGLGEELYIRFAFRIDEPGTFCIDSCSIPNQNPPSAYDWLFDSVSTFNGPYCWTVDSLKSNISGYIDVKNETTGNNEPLPYLEFELLAINGQDTTYRVPCTTNSTGDFNTIIPYTEDELFLKFSSIQSESSILYSFYNYYNLEPVEAIYETGFDGKVDQDIQLIINNDLQFTENNTGWFYKIARMMRDIVNTQVVLYDDTLRIDKIPILYTADTAWKHSWNLVNMQDPFIHINMDSSILLQAICHEIGHQIYYQINDDSIYYCCSTYTDHNVLTVSDTIFALNEGFPEFIHAISSCPDSIKGGYPWENIEDNSWWRGMNGNNKDGEIVEGAVASMLFDIYDDEFTPATRLTGEDFYDKVRDAGYMLPIIFDCFRIYAQMTDPDTTNTWRFDRFARRLLGDSLRWWYNNDYVDTLLQKVCDIFDEHEFKFKTNKSNGDLCVGSNNVPETEEPPTVIPMAFNVFQNYPNPFNAFTEIKFILAQKGDCDIEIFNILGQRVWAKKIPDMEAGEHTIVLDYNLFENLASGVYIYRVSSNESQSTRKMMLLK